MGRSIGGASSGEETTCRMASTTSLERTCVTLPSLNSSVVPLWSAMMHGARGAASNLGYLDVPAMPLMVGVTGACENVDTLFKVEGAQEFFGGPAFLAQSDQLYLELLTHEYEKVSTEIQSFRMEEKADARRLCQFTLFEIERRGGLDELLIDIEAIVTEAMMSVAERLFPIESEHYAEVADWCIGSWPRISYASVINDILDLSWGTDLTAEHEQHVVAEVGGPCFVTHYPAGIKFFNMRDTPGDTGTVESADLLLPYAGESAGCAARQTDYDSLVRKLKSSDMYRLLKAQGVPDEAFDWYLNFHRDNEVKPHAGAGIGMARVAQAIMGATDIRSAVPFPINKEMLP